MDDEAWATVLLSSSPAEGLVQYSEAVRTLQFSLECLSKQRRRFLVLTDGALPSEVTAALADGGAEVRVVDTTEVAAAVQAASPDVSSETTSGWNRVRGLGGAVAIKFFLWTLEPFKRVVFLDADTLALDNVEELFDIPPGVFASDGVFVYQDVVNNAMCTLNFGVMSLSPSRAWFQKLVDTLPQCKELIMHYPLHDLTDATFLDCAWRSHTRCLGPARFHFDTSHLPNCEGTGDKEECLYPIYSDGKRQERAASALLVEERPFSGCYEKKGIGFISAVMLKGEDKPYVRCALPLSYAAPVDFKSLFWLAGWQFMHGALKGRRFPTAESTTEAISKALVTSSLFVGSLKILHWPSVFMKPWDHCGPARTTFDMLWWAMRGRMCASTPGACRVACGGGD